MRILCCYFEFWFLYFVFVIFCGSCIEVKVVVVEIEEVGIYVFGECILYLYYGESEFFVMVQLVLVVSVVEQGVLCEGL